MILFQRAIPKISLTFDIGACITPDAPINHCMIYCATKPYQYSHIIVKTLVEDWLRTARQPYPPDRPIINLKFEYVSTIHRDRLFQNGYSVLCLIPGLPPILHWGCPGNVSMHDLMGMATVIKTFLYYYETDLKPTIARRLQCTYPVDYPQETRCCRAMVHELFRQVSNAAREQRIAYGRSELYVAPENTCEDEYFYMLWHTSKAYRIRVDFDNFDLKFLVPQKLFDLFDSCFGAELTYHMVPEGE